MNGKENIIDYDFQGWPVYRMSLREIIEKFCKHEDGKYFIEDADPVLNAFPVTLEDDGMGYGINDKYITEFNIVDNNLITVFINKPLPNIELWRESKIDPWQNVKAKGREGIWWVIGIRKGEEGLEYRLRNSKTEDVERIWIKESDIDDE